MQLAWQLKILGNMSLEVQLRIAAAAAGADNAYAAGNIIINGFAGTATVASSQHDTAREARDDINAIADKIGVTAKAATHVHLCCKCCRNDSAYNWS